MRRIILLGMMAASLMFATSCQNEEIAEGGNLATVSFSVGTPEIASRAYSDGTTATVLQYAVYDEAGVILPALTKTDATINGSTTINLQLTTGNTYSVIFWAAAQGAPYTVDFGAKTMTVDYTTAVSNDENRDAFYKYHTFTVTGAQTETIELKRPFAQLNIGTADYAASANAGYTPTQSSVKVMNVYSTLNLATGAVDGSCGVNFATADIKKDETFPVPGNEYIAMNYMLVAADKEVVDVEFTYTDGTTAKTRTVGSVPVQRNYRTNIYGQLLTSEVDVNVVIKPEYEEDSNEVIIENGQTYIKVENVEGFSSAFEDENIDGIILKEDIVLNASLSRATTDPSLVITNGKEFTIDLNGKTLSATSEQVGKNYDMILVKGNLTVKNGTITTQHTGANMLWNSMTTIFDVTAGGVLNLEGVTAQNLGGSDMAFVAHLNNWGEVTLNVDNCTLESTYIPVRVFNSGNDMNNVTIKNSTLKGGSRAFWVHNYTVEDFGSQDKADAHKALLNLNIYNQGNKFTPDVEGICYGFTNSVNADAYGITKAVSEDGSIVTLGSVVEDGLIRRGVAGTEENTTVKKVVVGEGVATLYDRTFRRFYALETVELPSTLTTIGAAGSGVFQSCTNLKNIVIPESVTVLGKGTFQECSSLTSINIPAGVTRIEENALRSTGLVSVEFHEGVTYFGAMAFRDCKQLTKVVINAPKFTMENNTFGIMAAPLTRMTINVANAEMKAYVESMLTDHAKTYITVVAPGVVDNIDGLKAEIANNASQIIVSGEIDLADVILSGYNGTIIGTEGAVLNTRNFTPGTDEAYQLRSQNLTFKNLTIKLPTSGDWIKSGFVGTGVIVFENCKIEGQATLNGQADWTFKNCEFVSLESGKYASFVYGAKKATFNSCSFSGVDRAAKVYGAGGILNVEYNNCTYTSATLNKAGVEIDATYATTTVTLNGCTQNNMKDLYALEGSKGTVNVK